jgi:thioredoxin-like negative regulator of GroEL
VIDRLAILLAVALAGGAAFALFRQDRLRRASRVAPAIGRPALLYFRSDACVPCAAQGRYVEQVQAEYGDLIVIQKVDADKDQATAERYGVFTLPTTLIVDGSCRVTHANYGLTDATRLARQLLAAETDGEES